MQATRNSDRTKLSQVLAEFPRKHLLIASAAVAALFVCLLLIPGHGAEAKRNSLPLEISIAPAAAIDELPIIAAEEKYQWQVEEVRKGDSLSKIFHRAELNSADVHEIVTSSADAKKLTRIYPGQKLSFHINDDGNLDALKLTRNRLESTLFERNAGGFSVEHHSLEPVSKQRYSTAIITSSLYKAAESRGLSQDIIMEMANIFGGVIDFVYDVRAGDSFNILYEEKFVDGEKVGNGAVLAAEFTNQGQTYTAYRYVYESGDVGYYTLNGVSMRKAFLRSPVDFTRISSSFNLTRLHPIFKTNKPHRGIDYAAATGTPVYASGDGRVSRAGYSKANGNYVVINHGQQYQTKYLHLHKRAVKNGQKVKQKQIIGWVGSTGYATGAHLHYEFLVNGVHRNPRTILRKLPKAKSIDEIERPRFYAQIKGVQIQLAAYNNQRKLASADQAGSPTL